MEPADQVWEDDRVFFKDGRIGVVQYSDNEGHFDFDWIEESMGLPDDFGGSTVADDWDHCVRWNTIAAIVRPARWSILVIE